MDGVLLIPTFLSHTLIHLACCTSETLGLSGLGPRPHGCFGIAFGLVHPVLAQTHSSVLVVPHRMYWYVCTGGDDIIASL
jgi:hypothetical protein